MPLADGGDFAALGGLYSTVRDLARWSGVFLDAEPPRDAPEGAPVSRATLREMQRARSAFAPGVEWQSLAEPPGVIAGGYGYGLMIWHERDGQKHVGHPGGLPGYGTLMRWVPELGLSAILLANVTYAKCEMPLRRALQLVAREAALPKRIIRADPGLLAARDAVDGLVARWDDGAAARLFSPNVDLDEPLAERRAELEALAERHGALERDGELEPEDALRGRWRLRGERGHVDLDITMAPTVPPLVQTLGVESVLPPAGLLATLATAAVDVVREPRREALGALLSPAVDAAETLRGFRVAAALYGPFGDPEPVAGDGETTTTLRLPSDRGAVDLELELDATAAPGAPRAAPRRPDRPACDPCAELRTPRWSRSGEQNAPQIEAQDRRARDHPETDRERARDVAQGAERERGERADAVADAEHHPDDPGHLLGLVGGVERQRHHQREDGAVAAADHECPEHRMRRIERDPDRPGRIEDARRDEQRTPRPVEAIADERHEDRRDDRDGVDHEQELPGAGVRPAVLGERVGQPGRVAVVDEGRRREERDEQPRHRPPQREMRALADGTRPAAARGREPPHERARRPRARRRASAPARNRRHRRAGPRARRRSPRRSGCRSRTRP